jgi:hypothetical protein
MLSRISDESWMERTVDYSLLPGDGFLMYATWNME